MPGTEIVWMNQTSVLAEPAVLPPGLAEPREAPDEGRPRLAASLLTFQAAMYVVTAVEAAAMSAISGAAGWGLVVLSLLLVFALLRSARRVRQHRPWRRVRVLEFSLLGWAAIDLALAVFLSTDWLGLLPTLTRIAVPVTVIVLLSKKQVR
jgi:hypothetical protein